MQRHEISVEQWAAFEPHLPGKAGDPGRMGQDNRFFVDAVFWIARTALRGGTCPNDLGHGIRSIDDSIIGASAKSWNDCSKRSEATPNYQTLCSTRRSFELTNMRRAQKGRKTPKRWDAPAAVSAPKS